MRWRCVQRQGFDELVVPDEDEAVGEELLQSLQQERGVRVVAAKGGATRARGYPEYAFVPMLSTCLLVAEEE